MENLLLYAWQMDLILTWTRAISIVRACWYLFDLYRGMLYEQSTILLINEMKTKKSNDLKPKTTTI